MTDNQSAVTAAELDTLIAGLRWSGGPYAGEAADAIAALRWERDEALRDGQMLERTHRAIPDEFCFDPPDGGDVKPWEAAERMAEALADARANNATLRREVETITAERNRMVDRWEKQDAELAALRKQLSRPVSEREDG